MCDIFIYIYYELCWRPVRQGVNMAGRIYNTHTLIRIYKYKYNIYISIPHPHTCSRAPCTISQGLHADDLGLHLYLIKYFNIQHRCTK